VILEEVDLLFFVDTDAAILSDVSITFGMFRDKKSISYAYIDESL
jgi:hypothetical protein